MSKAKRRYPNMDTPAGIGKNLQQIIKDCRSGELDVAQGSKLAYMLKILLEIQSTSDLDKRLKALEGE